MKYLLLVTLLLLSQLCPAQKGYLYYLSGPNKDTLDNSHNKVQVFLQTKDGQYIPFNKGNRLLKPSVITADVYFILFVRKNDTIQDYIGPQLENQRKYTEPFYRFHRQRNDHSEETAKNNAGLALAEAISENRDMVYWFSDESDEVTYKYQFSIKYLNKGSSSGSMTVEKKGINSSYTTEKQ